MYTDEYNNRQKLIKKIILLIIVIGIIVVICSLLFKPKKSNDFEKRILSDAEAYVRATRITSNQFITLYDIEQKIPTSYNTCNKSTGVYYNNGNYELYVKCSKYESANIENINNKKYQNITLKEDSFIITSKSNFKDPGYVSNYKVEVIGNSNYNKQGLYTTTYLVKDSANNVIEQAQRYVLYTNYNNELKNTIMTLLGDKNIYIKKGKKFVDPGVKVIDENGVDVSANVKTTGIVNTSIPGTYTINYSLNQLVEERTVTVTSMDVIAELSETGYTNKSVYINIKINSSEYAETIFPNDTTTKSREINYEVYSNGTYIFRIKDRFGSVTMIEKQVTNIDKVKPSVTCTGKSENKITTIMVDAKDENGIAYYKYGTYSGEVSSSNYVANSTIYNMWVTVADNAGNVTEASCNITVVEPPKEEPTPEPTRPNPTGNYKLIRLTSFTDAGLAKCGSSCVQQKLASGDIEIDERGWYKYKYNGKFYYVIAAAINDDYCIDKWGDRSYTDITYYNYYDTFTMYISDTSSSSSLIKPDERFKAYDVIVLDVCGACLKFSKNVMDIYPTWSTNTIEKWRADAYKGNSIKLDLWRVLDESVNPGDWAFLDN